jgi:hypothetical protein
MEAYPVAHLVSSPDSEGPSLIRPDMSVTAPLQPALFT